MAFRIYVAAILLAPVIGYFEPGEIPSVPPEETPILVAVVLLFALPFFGLIALLIYKAYRGRNWARLMLAAFTAGGAFLYADHVLALFAASPAVAAAQACLTIAQLVAVALLFSAPSNAWYRVQATRVHQAAA